MPNLTVIKGGKGEPIRNPLDDSHLRPPGTHPTWTWARGGPRIRVWKGRFPPDRAVPDYESGGQEFESLRARHFARLQHGRNDPTQTERGRVVPDTGISSTEIGLLDGSPLRAAGDYRQRSVEWLFQDRVQVSASSTPERASIPASAAGIAAAISNAPTDAAEKSSEMNGR